MTLEEKHLQAIKKHIQANKTGYGVNGTFQSAKECAKITLQHCIEVVQDIMYDFDNGSIGLQNSHNKIAQLQQQLSDLNK